MPSPTSPRSRYTFPRRTCASCDTKAPATVTPHCHICDPCFMNATIRGPSGYPRTFAPQQEFNVTFCVRLRDLLRTNHLHLRRFSVPTVGIRHVSNTKHPTSACHCKYLDSGWNRCGSTVYPPWHGRRSTVRASKANQRSGGSAIKPEQRETPPPRPQDRFKTECKSNGTPRGSSEQRRCSGHTRWPSTREHA